MNNALTNLLNKLDDGEMVCKASDVAPLFEMDAANLRCIALHAKEQLPFASYVIGKNIKFSVPSVLKYVVGCDVMTPQMIDAAFGDIIDCGEYCVPADLAKIFKCDPNTLRRAVRESPNVLGVLPVISGRRIKIPVDPFIRSITGC